jgi:hypothetical protein
VDDVVVVQVIDGLEDLSNRLRGILFCESALLADTVEQLPSSRQLCDDVVFILKQLVSRYVPKLEFQISLSTQTSPQT